MRRRCDDRQDWGRLFDKLLDAGMMPEQIAAIRENLVEAIDAGDIFTIDFSEIDPNPLDTLH